MIVRAGSELSWYFAVARCLASRYAGECLSLTAGDVHEAGTCFVPYTERAVVVEAIGPTWPISPCSPMW